MGLGKVLDSALVFFLSSISAVAGQEDTLGLGNGYISINTTNLDAVLTRDTQLLVSLKPAGQSFDFLPFDFLPQRAGYGQQHWGDITLRYRKSGTRTWTDVNSALSRKKVSNVTTSTTARARASGNLGWTLASAGPLKVTRSWLDVDGDLGLEFIISNSGDETVEIGSLGFPAEFNNMFNRTYDDIWALCSLSDPYIGMHAGFIQVTPVKGDGPALVVTPLGDTPLEGYRNVVEPTDDPDGIKNGNYTSVLFEGLYEWQMLTKAWAEDEWKGAQPWNSPSSRLLGPGKSLTAALRFTVSSGGVVGIEDTVRAKGVPLVRGIPGYIITNDNAAQLVVYAPPGVKVQSITSDPASALTTSYMRGNVYRVTPSSEYTGLARVTITYSDGRLQTVHYNVKKASTAAVSDLGHFLTTAQWFDDTSDPFGRAPSVLSYDHDAGKLVTQDDRVWIAGLSDEAGAGSFLAAAMKQAAQPAADEMDKLEQFVDGVLWKSLQSTNGSYAVRRSLFFYQPDLVPGYKYDPGWNWTRWSAYNQSDAYDTDRAYNYVHVASTYWALYRAGRAYPSLLTRHPWHWYLRQSYATVMACTASNGTEWQVGLGFAGLMGETVFGELLSDLKREGWMAEAAALVVNMKMRADIWENNTWPWVSEIGWDSAAQEGVYYWSSYFGYNKTAERTVKSVMAYQPTLAHWGWNGNARRYWDFVYGGKLRRIERQIHHYGSGLNALVALAAYRRRPHHNYLLRIGYGGMTGPLSNIHDDGFASSAFHSWPDTLRWDAYSGDYGPNFVGLVLGAATYVTPDPDAGWVAYGGVVVGDADGIVTVRPRDAVRRKVFVAPVGLLVTIDAGVIEEVQYVKSNGSITLVLGQLKGVPRAAEAVLWCEREDGGTQYTLVSPVLENRRLGWAVPLGGGQVSLVLAPKGAVAPVTTENNGL